MNYSIVPVQYEPFAVLEEYSLRPNIHDSYGWKVIWTEILKQLFDDTIE